MLKVLITIPMERAITAPQNPFMQPPRLMRATPDPAIKPTYPMESKLKNDLKLDPANPLAATT